MARLGYRPRVEFLELLLGECEARRLEGFTPLDLTNVLNGEGRAHRPGLALFHAGHGSGGCVP